MKKVLILGTVLSSLLFLGACSASKKEVTPAPTVVEQNFPNPTVKIGLTIHVLASSEAARSAGLDGAKVIAKQNGNTYQGTTDESGIVTFGDLKEGYVSYYVTKAGYAKINGLIELEYDGTPIVNGGNGTAGSDVTVNNEQFYAISEVATLPRLGASVSGVLMADLDFGGAADVTPVNAGKVVLRLDNSYEPNVYTATTSSTGEYTFENLPEDVSYTLSTQGIVGTVAATVDAPAYKRNLKFPDDAAIKEGTTPAVDQVQHRGLVTLE